MPELPEVETVRRGLVPVMEGRLIARAEVRRDGLRWPFPERLAERLAGSRVEALGRRSKVLLMALDTGETALVHLGMSGRMTVGGTGLGLFAHEPGGAAGRDPHAAARHDHVVLEMEGGAVVTLNDPRRFGMVDLWPSETVEAHRMLAGLGPEPLGNAWDGPALADRLAGRRTPVKAALLDQRVVAGLGNIYVCEALHRAGVDPRRHAGRLSRARAEALVPEIRAVLTEAIEAGGSTLRDHRRADGGEGAFQQSFRVYGREGEPCRRAGCGGTVRRVAQAGRSSFFCPACQR